MTILWAATGMADPAQLNPSTVQDVIDQALHRMYNADFAAAHTILEEEIRKHPDDPFLYAFQAAALLFSEFDRLKILELDFFADDETVTDRTRLKPDPAIRANFFQLIGQARKLALARLAVDPKDVHATFALFVAAGVETDYTLLVEKRYRRSYSLSKETHQYSGKLLEMNPPIYDAYLSSGMLEYVVGNLNWFFRLFVHFDQIKGNRQKAIEYLKLVIDRGRYYPPYAKMLLAVIYLRDNQPEQTLVLLKELEHDFPGNPLIRNEITRVSAKIRARKTDTSIR